MNLNKKLKRNNEGFTLLELIVTVVILALVTAPFLHSFITASNTNLKSKRIQESNELSQYIIEQFKASSVEKLISTYKLSDDNSYKIDGNAEASIKYTGSVSSSASTGALPQGMQAGYSADITLTPAKSVVNEDNAIPVIDTIDRNECAVFVNNITKYDTYYSTANWREAIVTIDYDNSKGKYIVMLETKYYDISNTNLGSHLATWDFSKIPSVYILYQPKSSNDNIKINNYLSDTRLTDTVTGIKESVNVYLVNQKDSFGTFTSLNANNIVITEKPNGLVGNNYKLKNLVDKDKTTDKLSSTVIYTNMATGTSDKGNTVNGTIKMIKIDTVYNLDVTVKYSGKKVASYSATKTTSGN